MTKPTEKLIIAGIALAVVILHILPASSFEYHRDELLYFSLSNHLDFGYATVPPMTGFLAFIAKSIFGYSLLAARFFPAIMSGLLIYLSARMVNELKGTFRAQLLASVGVGTSMCLATMYSVFTPYFIDIFLWTLTIYLLIRYVNSQSDNYLLLIGAVAGLAFLNKYSILFLIASILIVIPFTRHRTLLANKFFYLGGALFLLIASPNIIWQFANNLPVISHMKELNDTQLLNVSRTAFLIEQLVLMLPFTLIILPGFLFFGINKEFKEYRFLLAVSGVAIFLFILLRGKSIYTAGLFPFLIVIGAIFVGKVAMNRVVFYAVFLLLTVLSVVMLPLSMPVLKPNQMVSYYDAFAKLTGGDFLRRDEDGTYRSLPQINADMLGWNEIAEKSYKAWLQVENKEECIIFCANYGQAGSVSIIGNKYGMPEPISFSESFKYWYPLQFKNQVREVIYVKGTDAMDSGNFNDTKNFFMETILIDSIQSPMAIEYGTKIFLFKNPRTDFNKFWKGQVQGM